jgi:hypothetical protein
VLLCFCVTVDNLCSNIKVMSLPFLLLYPIYFLTCVLFHYTFSIYADLSGRLVFVRSSTRIVGSNATRGIDICMFLFGVCVVLCVGSGLAMG